MLPFNLVFQLGCTFEQERLFKNYTRLNNMRRGILVHHRYHSAGSMFVSNTTDASDVPWLWRIDDLQRHEDI